MITKKDIFTKKDEEMLTKITKQLEEFSGQSCEATWDLWDEAAKLTEKKELWEHFKKCGVVLGIADRFQPFYAFYDAPGAIPDIYFSGSGWLSRVMDYAETPASL